MFLKFIVNNAFNFKILFLLAIFMVCIFSVANAEKPTAPVFNKNAPIKIQADTMRYYGKYKKSIFSGNVVAVNDNFTLTSDNITVFLTDNMDVDKIYCNGDVNFKTDNIVAISNNAEVDQKDQKATLTGDVKVWQGENLLTGDKVTMYYKENRIIVNSNGTQRVTITFKPGDNSTGKGLNFAPKSSKP